MRTRRVAVVGWGIISPLGCGWPIFAENLIEGLSAGKEITLFDAGPLSTRVAAEVNGFDLSSYVDSGLAETVCERFDRKVALGIAACQSAILGSGYSSGQVSNERVAVSLGTSLSYPSMEDLEKEIYPYVAENGGFDYSGYADRIRTRSPTYTTRFLFDEVSRWLAKRVEAKGGVVTHFSACAASTQAIGYAFQKIRRNAADLCFAGGYDSMINPFGLSGFIRLGALTCHNDEPERASRPFDIARDGFLLGEGAVIAVLEEWDSALKNERKIYGEVLGYGSSLDAASVTAPHPEAIGAILSMRRALEDAGVEPEEIDYINAHGTATPLNDPMETHAIQEVFRGYVRKIPVSSSKSMCGHLLAAAGALEMAACLVAFESGKIPPTINLDNPDPKCDLDHVANRARPAEVCLALSNSFAFGGINATLVVKRFNE